MRIIGIYRPRTKGIKDFFGWGIKITKYRFSAFEFGSIWCPGLVIEYNGWRIKLFDIRVFGHAWIWNANYGNNNRGWRKRL